MAQKKETPEEKYNRLLKLDKTIKKLLTKNHAGIFSVPNPMTKTNHLMIMDIDDLEEFNKQVDKNIEEYRKQEESKDKEMKKLMTEKGDNINQSKKTK